MKTCGYHGEMLHRSKQTMGCWCYMPLAAKLPDKQCWIDAMGLKGKWTE
jgi:hypothetical protein